MSEGMFSEGWVRAALEHNAETVAHMVVEYGGAEWSAMSYEAQDEVLAFGRRVVRRLGARIGVTYDQEITDS